MADHTTATEREAIATMQAAEERWLDADDADFFDHHRVAAMLAALSGDVHARLAIEKGALELVTFTKKPVPKETGGFAVVEETPLYRLVDPRRPEDNV